MVWGSCRGCWSFPCLSTFKVLIVSSHLRPQTRSDECSRDPLISQPDSPGKRSLSCPLFVLPFGTAQSRGGPERMVQG